MADPAESSEETKVVERVDAVITDLSKGRIRGQKLGELGNAVKRAESGEAVGRAIGKGVAADTRCLTLAEQGILRRALRRSLGIIA